VLFLDDGMRSNSCEGGVSKSFLKTLRAFDVVRLFFEGGC